MISSHYLLLLMMIVLALTAVLAFIGYQFSKRAAARENAERYPNTWVTIAPKIWLLWIAICVCSFIVQLTLYLNS